MRFYQWKVRDHSVYERGIAYRPFQWNEMDGKQIEKGKVKEKFVNERTINCE